MRSRWFERGFERGLFPESLMIGGAVMLVAGLVEERRISQRFAVHEAGHALVARRLMPELGIVDASIRDRPSFFRRGGHVGFATLRLGGIAEDLPIWTLLDAERDKDGVLIVGMEHAPPPVCWKFLAVDLGGIASEMARGMLDRREFAKGDGGYMSDMEDARKIAATLGDASPPWPCDPAAIVDVDVDFSAEDHPLPMRIAYAEAKRVLAAEVGAVDRLRNLLLDEGSMDGPSVVSAIEGV